jgi:hypothetical protein
VGAADSKWIPVNGLDRTPDIQNLKTASRQAFSIFTKVALDVVECSALGLINVCSFYWSTFIVRIKSSGVWSTDCVIENVNTRGPSSDSLT